MFIPWHLAKKRNAALFVHLEKHSGLYVQCLSATLNHFLAPCRNSNTYKSDNFLFVCNCLGDQIQLSMYSILWSEPLPQLTSLWLRASTLVLEVTTTSSTATTRNTASMVSEERETAIVLAFRILQPQVQQRPFYYHSISAEPD